MKRKETLWELQERYDKALAESGQRVSGRLGKIQRSTVIIRRHELLGKDRIDYEVVADYINEVVGKLNDGVIKSNHANSVLREARQFLQFVKTGEVKMANPQLGAKAVLRPEFRQIVDDFLLSDSAMLGAGGKETSPNTRNDMRWVAHKYFEWLGKQEISDMRGVGAEQIQKFMLYCSETMAMDSVHNIRLHLKKLYAYLCAAGISKSSYEALLSFKVNRGNKIPETRGANELAATLDAIDRSAVDGKRAYAVMMLGITYVYGCGGVSRAGQCDGSAVKLENAVRIDPETGRCIRNMRDIAERLIEQLRDEAFYIKVTELLSWVRGRFNADTSGINVSRLISDNPDIKTRVTAIHQPAQKADVSLAKAVQICYN
ncbi:hypothetical protein FACS1894202_11600 [Clostridia bacterium]|nr:hypothetical protein FACS1894202_11600 [Clostridia bacterium]